LLYTVIINVAHLCVTNVKEPWGNWVCTSAMGKVETMYSQVCYTF